MITTIPSGSRTAICSSIRFDAMQLEDFEVLTFDCYGTLINWEAGILPALRPMVERRELKLSDKQILDLYAELEPRAQEPPYRCYREVLEKVVEGFAERLGFVPTFAERASLHSTLAGWPPFADTVEALRELREKYRLAIISNTDDDLFAGTAARLGVRFDWVITAQQVRAYKPSPVIFEHALQRIAAPRQRILHVGESPFHDIAPARALGISTVWVNRAQGKPAASRRQPCEPDLTVPNLKALAAQAA